MAIRKSKYDISATQNTLYTKGGEYTLQSTGEEYVGQYYIKGSAFFTGKPGNSSPQRLLPYTYPNADTYHYDKAYRFANPIKTHQSPVFFRPQPTTSDYQTGYIQRYVVSYNLNETRFPVEIGISQANTYGSPNSIDSGLWTLHKIKWVIAGSFEDIIVPGQPTIPSIETRNRITMDPIIKRYPAMQFAFRNYLEFAQLGI